MFIWRARGTFSGVTVWGGDGDQQSFIGLDLRLDAVTGELLGSSSYPAGNTPPDMETHRAPRAEAFSQPTLEPFNSTVDNED